MTTATSIDRPVFIVGCGRSGTTVLYDLLCAHPDLAWISNYSQYYPLVPPVVARFSDLYRSDRARRWLRGRLPQPEEAYPLWDYCRPVDDSPCDPPLTEQDITPRDRQRTHKAVAAHLHHQRKPRFINKNTRNTRRVRYLNGLFPDALFVHILRDPRATVNSLMNVDFWPGLRVWCEDNVTPTEWQARGKPGEVLAARLWRAEVQAVLNDRQALPAERYFELHYEDLMERPQALIGQILEFTGLPQHSEHARFIDGKKLRNMNYKYRDSLDPVAIARIDEETGTLAAAFGYPPGSDSAPRQEAAAG